MAYSGMLSFPAAVALVLGDNIGTTITAQLAALRTNQTGRQAAMAHTLIKCFGVSYMLPLVWFGWYPSFIEWLTPGELNRVSIMAHIALAHSVFNIVNTVVCLPLVNQIEMVVEKITPRRDGQMDVFLRLLDTGLLQTPHLALDQVRKAMVEMLKISQEALKANLDHLLGSGSVSIFRLQQLEDSVDHCQLMLTQYLADLTQPDIGPNVSEAIAICGHGVRSIERIGDYAEGIGKEREDSSQSEINFSQKARTELGMMVETVWEMFNLTVVALGSDDKESAKKALRCERRLDEFQQEFRRSHIDRLMNGGCDQAAGVVFLEVIRFLKNTGGQLANIDEAVLASYHIAP
jgi:phosphate:Na+ symporter